MLDYAIHQLAGYRLLARCGPAEDGAMRDLRDALRDTLRADGAGGLPASDEPDVAAVGAILIDGGDPRYVAGVPATAAAPAAAAPTVEGYSEVTVPGGAFAMVTYDGDPAHIGDVIAALSEAASAAGEAVTGESIEVYRRAGGAMQASVDLGVRLAGERPDAGAAP